MTANMKAIIMVETAGIKSTNILVIAVMAKAKVKRYKTAPASQDKR